jgi:hypothetical protein
MKKVITAVLSFALFAGVAPAVKAEVAKTPPAKATSSLAKELGPIQGWDIAQGRVNAIELGELTPMSFDWFLELIAAKFPEYKHIIMARSGVLEFGNAYCASGTAVNPKRAAIYWSVCAYQIEGVKLYDIVSVSVDKNAKLSSKQEAMIEHMRSMVFDVPLSAPVEPIDIK